jgi:hypothetical protein
MLEIAVTYVKIKLIVYIIPAIPFHNNMTIRTLNIKCSFSIQPYFTWNADISLTWHSIIARHSPDYSTMEIVMLDFSAPSAASSWVGFLQEQCT